MTAAEGFAAEQKFSAVWHAQLFALTVHLYDKGVFTWPEWTAALGRHLRAEPPHKASQPDDQDSYYLAWMAALMDCLAGKQLTTADEVQKMYDRWAAAYLAICMASLSGWRPPNQNRPVFLLVCWESLLVFCTDRVCRA